MKITLTGDESLRVEPTPGALTIEAPSADRSYSPFHMLGSSLAMCTFSVLQSYAANKNLNVGDLTIDVSWTFAEGPHRVDAMEVRLKWPSLPAEMWQRAMRVANLCGVHNTLTHSPTLTMSAEGAAAPDIEGISSNTAPEIKAKPSANAGAAKTSAANTSGPAVPQADGQPKATSAP